MLVLIWEAAAFAFNPTVDVMIGLASLNLWLLLRILSRFLEFYNREFPVEYRSQSKKNSQKILLIYRVNPVDFWDLCKIWCIQLWSRTIFIFNMQNALKKFYLLIRDYSYWFYYYELTSGKTFFFSFNLRNCDECSIKLVSDIKVKHLRLKNEKQILL